jgi:proline iminopeptidase
MKGKSELGKIILTIFLLLIAAISIHTQEKNEKRETIHDRIISIEPKLITEIPNVPRLCDQLPLKKQKIDVGDCYLYVEEEGSGTPLVLINGGPGGTHHGFHPWFGNAAKYARIIYYDQRGCGLSDYKPGKNGYSVEQATDDLDAIRKALKIEKWVVLGFSYGGFLAQYYTLRYPTSVSGLVLLGASPGLWTSVGSSREDQFVSDHEQNRMKEINQELNELIRRDKITGDEYLKLMIYNNHLNGDWKRQQYYKPSKERIAQIALYEWAHDDNFNSIMNQSAAKIDLTGAFDANPVPTLIMEGKWDLTWYEEKKNILKANHPHSRMVVFENAGHGIYDEETEKFFSVLQDFITKLPPVNDRDLELFRGKIAEWEKAFRSRPDYLIQSLGWGIVSSKKLVEEYQRASLEKLTTPSQILRMGFAQYDMKQYSEALFIFELLEKKFGSDTVQRGLALIWQGHMLDLLGKREDALIRYNIVVGMNHTHEWQHGQYGLSYKLSPYAKERMVTPFKRLENRTVD